MIMLKGKDYTNCIGDYVKDLEKAYMDATAKKVLYEEKYNSILIAFKTLFEDVKEL